MSTTLKISNFPSLNRLEISSLNADTPANTSALTLESNQGYAVNDFIILGVQGGEAVDLVKVQALTGNTGITTVSPTKYPHYRFDSATKLFGDQIKIYTAPNVNGLQPADSQFTALAGGLFNIDPDQASTQFTDAVGDSSKWYKYTFVNSVSLAETNLADVAASRGGAYANYCTVEDIRQRAGLQSNRYIADTELDSKRVIAQAEIDAKLGGLYVVPFLAPINALISEVAAELAAGLFLTTNHSANSSGTARDGEAKLKNARDILDRIKAKELILTDATGVSTDVPTSGTVTSWPNSTTADLDESDAGGARMFRISHRY